MARSTICCHLAKSGSGRVEAEQFHDGVIEIVIPQDEGHLIDILHIRGRDHGIGIDIAEEGNLLADCIVDGRL